MIIFPFGGQKVLGIDFGSFNIKIVEVVKKKDKLEIINFGSIPIINFKTISASSYILEENLALILGEFFRTANIKAREVIFNIPAPYIFPANFFAPLIPEKSLPQVIRFESQKHIPFSFEEIELEYRYQEFQDENQQRQWLVFIAGIPKSYLKKIQNIAEIAKLKLKDYSGEYFNLEPFFSNKLGNFVAVDCGHSYSTINLFKNGKVIYGNKISIRGYDFLDMLMNVTQLTEEKVLDLAYTKGFQFPPEEKEERHLANNFLDNITGLVREEIEKIESVFLLKIEKIYWTGGLAILPGFKEGVLERLPNYQQEILTPFEIFESGKMTDLKEKSTLFTQALGVVFRKLMS